MSWLDYHPLIGPFRDSFGNGGQEETADDMRDSDVSYSWSCSVCDSPISDADEACPACGEPVDWDEPPVT